MSKQSHRQRLIDTFINRIYLYDDKLIITFNHKDGAETITLNDVGTALTEQEDGSDLVSSAVPSSGTFHKECPRTFTSEGTRKGGGLRSSCKNSPVGCFWLMGEPLQFQARPVRPWMKLNCFNWWERAINMDISMG